MNSNQVQNNGLNNEQENDKLKELVNTTIVRREPIPGTPFTHICKWPNTEEEENFYTLGKHRVTEKFKSAADLDEWFQRNMWNVIATLVCVYHDAIMIEVGEEVKRQETQKNADNIGDIEDEIERVK